jgi:hypothetical protein
MKNNIEEVSPQNELIEGMFYASINETENYKFKSIWILSAYDKEQNNKIVEIKSMKKDEYLGSKILILPLEQFLMDFKEATEVLIPGEKGYAKAFNNNLKIKLN